MGSEKYILNKIKRGSPLNSIYLTLSSYITFKSLDEVNKIYYLLNKKEQLNKFLGDSTDVEMVETQKERYLQLKQLYSHQLYRNYIHSEKPIFKRGITYIIDNFQKDTYYLYNIQDKYINIQYLGENYDLHNKGDYVEIELVPSSTIYCSDFVEYQEIYKGE